MPMGIAMVKMRTRFAGLLRPQTALEYNLGGPSVEVAEYVDVPKRGAHQTA